MLRVLQCVAPGGWLSSVCIDHPLDLGVIDRARDAGPRLVEQPVQATLDKAPPPHADGLRRHPLVQHPQACCVRRSDAIGQRQACQPLGNPGNIG
jgi:hypothetical protein